jgi:hypothetical protein
LSSNVKPTNPSLVTSDTMTTTKWSLIDAQQQSRSGYGFSSLCIRDIDNMKLCLIVDCTGNQIWNLPWYQSFC